MYCIVHNPVNVPNTEKSALAVCIPVAITENYNVN